MRPIAEPQVETLIRALKTWSSNCKGVDGLAVVGLSAAARDHAECDLDLVCLVDDPERFRAAHDWMNEIDWPSAGLAVKGWTDVDFGKARSRHLKFDGGEELEMSFVDQSWAGVEPVDPATRRIAGDGLRVLHDPHGLLGRLLVAL